MIRYTPKGIVLKLCYRAQKKAARKKIVDKLNEMGLVWLRCTDADAINHALCSKLKTFYIAC